jgi:hypothetical protein
VGRLSSDVAESAEYARHIERVRAKTEKETPERACNLRENRKLDCSYATKRSADLLMGVACSRGGGLFIADDRDDVND